MTMTFKPGDVVREIGKTQKMTVERIGTDGRIICIWFSTTMVNGPINCEPRYDRELQRSSFIPDELVNLLMNEQDQMTPDND